MTTPSHQTPDSSLDVMKAILPTAIALLLLCSTPVQSTRERHRPVGLKGEVEISKKLHVMFVSGIYVFSATKQITVLAKGLKARGHRVTFTGPSGLQEFVEGRGFEFFRNMETHRNLSRNFIKHFREADFFAQDLFGIWSIMQHFDPAIENVYAIYDEVIRTTKPILLREKPDVVILDFVSTHATDLVASLNIPYIIHYAAPLGTIYGYNDHPAAYSGIYPVSQDKHANSLWERLKKALSVPMAIVSTLPSTKILEEYRKKNGMPHDPDPTFLWQQRPVLYTFIVDGAQDISRYISPLTCQAGLLAESIVEQLGKNVDEWPEAERELLNELNRLSKTHEGLVYMATGSVACADEEMFDLGRGAMEFAEQNNYAVMLIARKDCQSSLPSEFLKSDRMMIKEWVNQDLVLGHELTKVFITHGGQNSLSEAVINRVPVLIVPQWGDQMMSAIRMTDGNAALYIDYRRYTKREVASKLKSLITDPKYADNILRLHRINALGGGKERGVNFVETIGTIGWEHLIPLEEKVPLYVKYGMDLSFFFIIVPLFLLYQCLRFVCKCCCGLFSSSPNHRSKIKHD
mmetsp:Transcript_33253/g.64296  ORF Transcript_33253/g.64296 Transcript_33253/m.64296 type:complete len:575 (-) Transcript_33253:129-1853(-)